MVLRNRMSVLVVLLLATPAFAEAAPKERIYTIRLDGTQLRQLTHTHGNDAHPCVVARWKMDRIRKLGSLPSYPEAANSRRPSTRSVFQITNKSELNVASLAYFRLSEIFAASNS